MPQCYRGSRHFTSLLPSHWTNFFVQVLFVSISPDCQQRFLFGFYMFGPQNDCWTEKKRLVYKVQCAYRISNVRHANTLRSRSLLSISENVVHTACVVCFISSSLYRTQRLWNPICICVQFGMLMIEHVHSPADLWWIQLLWKAFQKIVKLLESSREKETNLCQNTLPLNVRKVIRKLWVWNVHSNEPILRHLDNTISTISFLIELFNVIDKFDVIEFVGDVSKSILRFWFETIQVSLRIFTGENWVHLLELDEFLISCRQLNVWWFRSFKF